MEDKVTVIRVSLEKILKAIVIKVENGDQISAANELKWFDDLLFSIYDLKTKNFELFKELIDPSNRHVVIERPELSKIDWSKVVYKESTAPRTSTQEARRSYNINVWQEEHDLLDSFISFSIKVWEASANAEQFGVARRALYAIGNIYGYVAFGNNTADKFNFISYYNFLNQVIIYRLDSLLSAKRYTEHNNSLIRFMMFQFHLDHFKDERFGNNKFENFSTGILGSLKVGIDRGQPDFIKAFVRALAGMILRPAYDNPYAELQNVVKHRFETLNIEQNDLLRKIAQLGFWKPYYLLTSHQYHTLIEKLDKLEKDLIGLTNKEDISSFIKEKITQIKSHALARHKYRLIQGALVKVLVYSIFKKQYDLVDFALEFEEPADADAFWGNRDILPNDLRDIMLLMYQRSHIQHELMPSFPDRHGSPRYIDIFCIALLYRYSKYKLEEHIVSQPVGGFLTANIDDWPEIHNTMTIAFQELQSIAKVLYQREEWPLTKRNDAHFDYLMKLLDEILRSIKRHRSS